MFYTDEENHEENPNANLNHFQKGMASYINPEKALTFLIQKKKKD